MTTSVLHDLSNPAKFRTLRRVPVFDAHPPVPKMCVSPSQITATNPRGLVQIEKGASQADLESLARNSNARARSGRLTTIQLGHTRAWDVPEHEQPKAVGFAHNFEVGEHEGKPHLFADLSYRASEYGEAQTYPRCSIHWSLWNDPSQQYVGHLAVLRSEPGRDLPLIQYRDDGLEVSLAGPAKLVHSAPAAPTVAISAERQAKIDARIRELCSAPPAAPVAPPTLHEQVARSAGVIEFARKNSIKNPAEARKRFDQAVLAGSAGSYSAGPPIPDPRALAIEAESRAVVAFCTKRHIRDIVEGRRLFHLENPGFAASLSYADLSDGEVAEMNRDMGGDPVANRDRLKHAKVMDLPPERVTRSGGPQPLSPFEKTDRTVRWEMPNGGRCLEAVTMTRGFRLAVSTFARLNRIPDAKKAADLLVEEVREALLGFDAQGNLCYPNPPAQPGPTKAYAPATAQEHYQKRKDAFWSNRAATAARAKKEEGERNERAAILAARSRPGMTAGNDYVSRPWPR